MDFCLDQEIVDGELEALASPPNHYITIRLINLICNNEKGIFEMEENPSAKQLLILSL